MRQAMILAAGLGTRLKPLTDTMPKALVKVGGRPLLDIVVERLLDTRLYDRLVVNVHHFAQQIVDHVAASSYAPLVHISDESDQLLETGGGLKRAARLFTTDEPLLIHNVDILDNVDYAWFARQHLSDEDAVLLVSRRRTKRYLLFNSAMRLMGWINSETGEVRSPFPWLREAELAIDDQLQVVEQPNSPSGIRNSESPILNSQFSILNSRLYAFAFSGIHSFSPRLFTLMDRFPDRFPIIDFYLSICHRAHIMGCVKDDLRLLDVGKLDTLQQAEDFLITMS